MTFRAKIDSFFVSFITIIILLIGAVTLLPALIDKEASLTDIIIITIVFIGIEGFIIWTSFFIKYSFNKEFLLVRGGLFHSKIPYEKIKKVTPTKNIFTGYRILSSKQGLELFYDTGIFGSVKISPLNEEEFINELKKRCPNIQMKN